MKLRSVFIIGMIFFVAACATKGSSALSDALTTAVKEKKISPKKKEFILAEYDKIRDQDKAKAHEYAGQVITAIEMGGDSTHIDAARMQVLREVKGLKGARVERVQRQVEGQFNAG